MQRVRRDSLKEFSFTFWLSVPRVSTLVASLRDGRERVERQNGGNKAETMSINAPP